jgi:hypothetical protein
MFALLHSAEDRATYLERLHLTLPTGLTDTVRQSLDLAGSSGLTAVEIKRKAKDVLSEYANPSAAVHNVLSRLVKSGEVEVTRNGRKPIYRMRS